jgi:glycerol-3-phosphate acyltransferase PlsY
MATGEIVWAVLALAIGLLLGSVLPADLLARRRGVDIRSVGDGNPGTVNAVRGLGWAAGLVTAAYDLSVGVLAIWIARLLGTTEGIAYAAGIMSIVGHRLPVFSGLRGGGQGMAASAGMLLYGVGVALSRGWLSAANVGALVAILLVTFVVTRSDAAAAVAMLPVLLVIVMLARPDWPFFAFLTTVAAWIWVVQIAAARRWLAARPVRRMRGRTQG